MPNSLQTQYAKDADSVRQTLLQVRAQLRSAAAGLEALSPMLLETSQQEVDAVVDSLNGMERAVYKLYKEMHSAD